MGTFKNRQTHICCFSAQKVFLVYVILPGQDAKEAARIVSGLNGQVKGGLPSCPPTWNLTFRGTERPCSFKMDHFSGGCHFSGEEGTWIFHSPSKRLAGARDAGNENWNDPSNWWGWGPLRDFLGSLPHSLSTSKVVSHLGYNPLLTPLRGTFKCVVTLATNNLRPWPNTHVLINP